MNLNKTAKQLQALFQETNKYVKGNWIAPEIDQIVKILRDNLQKGGDASCHSLAGTVVNNAAPTFNPKSAAQPQRSAILERARELLDHIDTVKLAIKGFSADATAISGARVALDALSKQYAAKPQRSDIAPAGSVDGKFHSQFDMSEQPSKASPLGERSDAFTCRKCGRALGWCEPNVCDKCSDQPSGSGRTTDNKQEWFYNYEFGDRFHVYFGSVTVGGVIVVTERQAKAICDAHNSELAAEREKLTRHIEAANEVTDENIELEQQLLSALAAIEHVRKREGCIVTDERLAQIIDNVELSALREHDAELIKKDRKSRPQPHFNTEVKAYVEKRIDEVRKPLVEALEVLQLRLHDQIAWYKLPDVGDYWVTKFTHDQVEGNLSACRGKIDNALAKVKEGK